MKTYLFVKFLGISIMFSFNVYGFCPAPLRNLPEGLTILDPECVYRASFRITKSHTTLDCRGAQLDGFGELKTGILVDSMGKELTNVEIANCHLARFKNVGVSVGWSLADYKKMPGEHPKFVTIKNVIISDIQGVGVFIDDHVAGARIVGAKIINSKGPGVYLEHDSRFSEIRDSVFINNGWDVNGNPAQPAIAIDASSNNRIEYNFFHSNGLAGIATYRNCDENFDDGKSVRRLNGANYNVIANNSFDNEKVSIWVAARLSKDLQHMKCGRKPYKVDGNSVFVEDESLNNVVSGNFIYSGGGIKIEMGPNTVIGNKFGNAVSFYLHLGSPLYYRATGITSSSYIVVGGGQSPLFLERQ